jgi:hypothetical protein
VVGLAVSNKHAAPVIDYGTPYLGTRRLATFTPPLWRRFLESPQFIDVTMGGARLLHRMAVGGKPIAGGDICYYVVNGLLGVFSASTTRETRSVFTYDAQRATDPAVIMPHDGYVSAQRREHMKAGTMSEATAGYYDGLFSSSHSPAVLAAAGGDLHTFTYRMAGWSAPLPGTDPSPRGAQARIMKRLGSIRLAAESLGSSKRQVLWGTVEDTLAAFDVTPGALVYADPAWPWAKEKGGDNPYSFAQHTLSSCILQREATTFKAWERTTRAIDIIEEVAGWIALAFAAGARTFVLSNQSTNWPEPMMVYNALAERFRMTGVQRHAEHGSLADTEYEVLWGIYEQ